MLDNGALYSVVAQSLNRNNSNSNSNKNKNKHLVRGLWLLPRNAPRLLHQLAAADADHCLPLLQSLRTRPLLE